jgi:hypothetical protein
MQNKRTTIYLAEPDRQALSLLGAAGWHSRLLRHWPGPEFAGIGWGNWQPQAEIQAEKPNLLTR